MKKAAYKQGIFAGGKSWSELEEAVKAEARFDEYWPKTCGQLMRRYAELYRETESLRQMELFAPPPVTPQDAAR